LKFNSGGGRIWATYYGGISDDVAESICTYNSVYFYVTGKTLSTYNFPLKTLAGAYNQTTYGGGSNPPGDAFILKFNTNCARLWATYYGGNGYDIGHSITTDNSGNLYVTGETTSSNFPIDTLTGAYNQTTSGGAYEAFILQFDSLSARLWATYYGGSGGEGGFGICTDTSRNLYVTGYTISSNFPTKTWAGAYNQTTSGSGWDAFILRFNELLTEIKNISNEIPEKYSLQQNYPNPFNPITNIKFDLPNSTFVKMIIYNALGKEINTLVNEKLSAGSYKADWNGTNYPSGVYFYKLITDEFIDVKKMVFIK